MLRPFLFPLAMLLGSLGSADAQDSSAWTRATPGQLAGAEATQSTRVPERNHGQLRIEGERLLRTRAEHESELGCTLAGGAGELFELAADPFGLTFIAAANGLFVTSPESEQIAPVVLADGAPNGVPSSLGFDADRRLWLATGSDFGVLEPSHYFGRRIEAPAPGPYVIEAMGPAGVYLNCGGERWIYRPDQGARPRIDVLRLGERKLSPGAQLEITFGDSLDFSVEATAAGGAVLRYAVDGDHVWKLLKDLGPQLEPGAHSLELVAMDRDLNLSPPFELRVRVLYPFYYQSSFVLALAGLLALLVYLWFQRRARTAGSPSVTRSLLSTLLLLVIALQILAGAIPHGRGWPFIGYSMYTESSDVGHISHNGVIVGFGQRGVPLRIPLGTLGLAADNRWQLLRPIMQGGQVPGAVIEKYNALHPEWEQVIRLQVWAKRTLIRAEGPLEIAPLVLSDYRLARVQGDPR